MADQLCTITQVKARLFPAGTTDTTDDTMLTELVEEVSDWIQLYTGRKFVPDNAATYVFDTVAGYVLRVPRGIRSVTAMGIATLSHQPDAGGTYVSLTLPGAILLRPSSGELPIGWPPTEIRLSRGAATPLAFGTIEAGATVTGNFGFAATPPAIQAVCIDGVVSAYQMRKQGVTGQFGMDNSPGVPWWQFSMTSKDTLKTYRDIGIA
jgi:hypothetical protein